MKDTKQPDNNRRKVKNKQGDDQASEFNNRKRKNQEYKQTQPAHMTATHRKRTYESCNNRKRKTQEYIQTEAGTHDGQT